MIRFVFLDLDDTLLDFGWAERRALSRAYADMGSELTDEIYARYHAVNQDFWERFERGEISRDTLLVERHRVLFSELGLPFSPEECERLYRSHLGEGHHFVEGAEALLAALAPKYRLFLASNGVIDTQYSRLESAGIGHYFEKIFISDELGVSKPNPAFFAACFSAIDGFHREEALMVGDSLTSDILGGSNAGIRTCWLNPAGKPRKYGIAPDYEIQRLSALPGLLAAL